MTKKETIPTDAEIEIIARRKALKYAYANEFEYEKFIKAIVEGAKWTRDLMAQKSKPND